MRLLIGQPNSNNDELKQFFDWVLGIHDGSIRDSNDIDITFEIPHDLLITTYSNSFAAIVESTYPSILNNIFEVSFSQSMTI